MSQLWNVVEVILSVESDRSLRPFLESPDGVAQGGLIDLPIRELLLAFALVRRRPTSDHEAPVWVRIRNPFIEGYIGLLGVIWISL